MLTWRSAGALPTEPAALAEEDEHEEDHHCVPQHYQQAEEAQVAQRLPRPVHDAGLHLAEVGLLLLPALVSTTAAVISLQCNRRSQESVPLRCVESERRESPRRERHSDERSGRKASRRQHASDAEEVLVREAKRTRRDARVVAAGTPRCRGAGGDVQSEVEHCCSIYEECRNNDDV